MHAKRLRTFCSLHAVTSSVIYYTLENVIYLLIISQYCYRAFSVCHSLVFLIYKFPMWTACGLSELTVLWTKTCIQT